MKRFLIICLFLVPSIQGMKRRCMDPESSPFTPSYQEQLGFLSAQARRRNSDDARKTLDALCALVRVQVGPFSDEDGKWAIRESLFSKFSKDHTAELMLKWVYDELAKRSEGDIGLIGMFSCFISYVAPREHSVFGYANDCLEHAISFLSDGDEDKKRFDGAARFCRRMINLTNGARGKNKSEPWSFDARDYRLVKVYRYDQCGCYVGFDEVFAYQVCERDTWTI